MLTVALVMSAALGAAAPHAATAAPHVTEVEHQGARYEVTYQPHVRTKMRTIGMAAGTRPSTERCLWSAELLVSRSVAGAASGGKLLPARVVKGSQPGNCRAVRRLVEAEHGKSIARLHAQVPALAADDHHTLLADLATARTVAAN